jgi:hypothetical protein
MRIRIKEHRTVQAKELVPHPRNWRTHPRAQVKALQALLAEVGFARSLLAFETPDGQLMLIDGHLRRALDPEALVTVEILDVTPAEAEKLLLSLDPLAALAQPDQAQLQELAAKVQQSSAAVRALYQHHPQLATRSKPPPPPKEFRILITCRDETQQCALIRELLEKGLEFRPLFG